MSTVFEMLREAAETYEERNEVYGDNYKHFGLVMRSLFPEGVDLKSMDDFNRFGVLVQIVGKLGRYAANFDLGGHEDSLLDIAVYSQMLRELDREIESWEGNR